MLHIILWKIATGARAPETGYKTLFRTFCQVDSLPYTLSASRSFSSSQVLTGPSRSIDS